VPKKIFEQISDLSVEISPEQGVDKMVSRDEDGKVIIQPLDGVLTETPEYHRFTDEEIHTKLLNIAHTPYWGEEEIRQAIKDELGYNGTPAVSVGKPSVTGQRMVNIMVFGPTGNIISV
jgi:hypothetical protein